MIVKLLTEHHLEFLSLQGGCRGSSKSIHFKMPHCWKSHALAQILVEQDSKNILVQDIFLPSSFSINNTYLLYFLI